MKQKNGFTVIELILSFTVATIIIVLLFQLLISLKDLYNTTSYKTELFIKQSNISDKIYEQFNSKTIENIESCGENCLVFLYTDGSNSELSIYREQGVINFGNYTTNLVEDSYFGVPNIDYYKNVNNNFNNIDSYIHINIPIYHTLYLDENFGINIVYQYNSNEQYIIGEDF